MFNPVSSSNAERIEDLLIQLTKQHLSLTHKIDDLIHHVSPIPPQPNPFFSSVSRLPPNLAAHHRLKLEVPRFDGTDPMGWIFKINQFFEYHDTLEHDCLTIASFHMEGGTLAWFQWMTSNGQFTSWPVFLQALQTRFAPSQYEDPIGTLCKLTQ